MMFILIFIWLLFGIFTDWKFFGPQNLSNLFRQMTIISFLAIGMVLVIVTGNIDLSVGSATGLVSIITAGMQAVVLSDLLPSLFPGLEQPLLGIISTVLAIIVSLLAGALIGAFQGSIIAYLSVPAFIVTLGGMMAFRGILNAITQGKTIVPIEESLKQISQGYLPKDVGLILGILVVIVIFLNMFLQRRKKKSYGFALEKIIFSILKASLFSAAVIVYVMVMNSYQGVQNPVILMVVIALIFHYLANNTRFGRYAYAIGGNKDAARLSGINIKKNIFQVFVLMGLLCGVAGIVLTAKVAAGTISGGTGYELSVIAACVIGGTSLMGGEGTILGALIGALIMASLLNGMQVMNMQYYWQDIISGFILVMAAFIDVTLKRRKN
jgi:D-xylose transport system permease protein